jgi:hypothetical protein
LALKNNGFAKSPSAVLHKTFITAMYLPGTLHYSGFASLAAGAFCCAMNIVDYLHLIQGGFLHG